MAIVEVKSTNVRETEAGWRDVRIKIGGNHDFRVCMEGSTFQKKAKPSEEIEDSDTAGMSR